MSKNIVIFSDGTGQEGGTDHNTNVYKLFNLILDRSPRQISFYDKGLGTGVRKASGNIAGRGFSKNVKQCYQFIFQNYEDGDKIYLFGFSRGAATVRSLTGFIHLFGILPRSRGELVKAAWKIYMNKDEKERKKQAKAFIEKNHNMWAYVEFLGVWDTVAALGVPSTRLDKIVDWIIPHGFHDFTLSKCVKHAYQALAIDDVRKTFHPVLFHPYRKKDNEKVDESVWPDDYEEDPRVRQVWFMGMHTDVGGGYIEKELSHIVLEWMVQHAVKHGLRLYNNKKRKKSACQPTPNDTMHDSRDTIWKRIVFRKEVRHWEKEVFGKPIIPSSVILPAPIIHESATLRTADIYNVPNGGYNPWILKLDHEIERWTHLEDWKHDAAFAKVDPKTLEALEGWCQIDAI